MSTRSSAILLLVLLFLPLDARAQLADGNSTDRECTKCSDLCSLVDQYWQKERVIEIWKKYAASTPQLQRTPVPPEVTNLGQFYEFLYEQELPKTWAARQLPCESVPEWMQEPPKPPLLRPGGDGTGLETKGFEQSCEIVYRGKKLEGDTEKEWRKTHACKGSAQAELEHERVHQKICQNTFAQYPDTAVQRLTSFRNIAESELQAWKKHRDLLREEIQKLARNCGWEPTDRQRADPDSVPTETQTKKMEERGWKAFNVLSSTPP
ncbi:MAG TPA: hypothetical protein VFV69_03565 [Steroidobacteraceae bacterium]|jgi:hypothetical protein|nr:hypothetical protein [Steroidobacteraceae bacterium]